MKKNIILILLIILNLILYYYIWNGIIVEIGNRDMWFYLKFEISPLKYLIK